MNEGVLESALQRAETYAYYRDADLAEQAVHLMAGSVFFVVPAVGVEPTRVAPSDFKLHDEPYQFIA